MERRVVLAVVLTVAVIFLTNLLFPPVAPPPAGSSGGADATAAAGAEQSGGEGTAEAPVSGAPDAEESGALGAADAGAAGGAEGAAGAASGGASGGEAGLPGAELALAPADTVVVRTDLFELRFSTRGASLVGAKLLGYESFAAEGETDDRVRLVRPGDAMLGYRIAAGGDTARLDERIFTADRRELRLAEGARQDSLRFTYDFPSGGVRFVVVYRFRPGTYLVDVEGRLEGFGERGWSVITGLGTGLRTNEKERDDDLRSLAYVANGVDSGIESVPFEKLDAGETTPIQGGPFRWVAVKNKYFLVALLAPESGPRFGGALVRGDVSDHVAHVLTSMPVPAGNEGFAFRAFVGPQEYDRLETAGQGLEGVNPYGWRWLRPIIRPLVGLVMLILGWMHNTLTLAYGWVLILFGVLMRVVLFPLYQKSMRAQLAQMRVQPLMKEIQERHKDDPQVLQQEMMKLYREHNINPLAGCLPMLVPMPILFTLFFVFQGTIEFRGVPFLWLPDLSLKDPLFIIPLLMGASMFLLSWIGQRGMEQTNPQMKMMTYVLPVVFTVMFATFPSGLNLYYTTSNLASLPQQLFLSRERRAAGAAAPAPAGRKGDAGRKAGADRKKRGGGGGGKR
ncbi:MAG: membrane protein insertase YidC [Gemmatimonadota bacterium]|nr:membrane protein insertase YidC [Gemmatimonadota bacterium]